MLAWLGLGFLMGLQHAVEADHIAAVVSLVSDKTGLRSMARHGALWGLGHSLTLAAFGGAAFALKLMITPGMGKALELAVGLMLVALGLRIVYRLWRDRVHFHVHRHAGKAPHLHVHSHAGDVADHKASYHLHSHPAASWRRSLGVGMMHGLAGSAAIVALTAAGTSNAIFGLLFIAIFGIGSMLGMALFTSVISWPLTLTARRLTWANRGLQLAAGVIATLIGLNIVYAQAGIIATLFG